MAGRAQAARHRPWPWTMRALADLNRFGFYALGVCKGRDVRQRRPTAGWRMDVVGYLAALNFLELVAGVLAYFRDSNLGLLGLSAKTCFCMLVVTLYSQSLWRSKLDIQTGDKLMAAMMICSGLCSIFMFCSFFQRIETYRLGQAGVSLLATLALCMLPGFGRGGLGATLSVSWALVPVYAVCGLIVHTECNRYEAMLLVFGLVFHANLICTCKHVIFINKEDFTRLVTGEVPERESSRPGPRPARRSANWGSASGLLPMEPSIGAAVLELKNLRVSLTDDAATDVKARIDRIISRLESPSRVAADRVSSGRFNRFDWLAQNPAVPRHVLRFLTLEMAGGRELLSRELIQRQRSFRTGSRDAEPAERISRPSDGILNSSMLNGRHGSGEMDASRSHLASPTSAHHFTIDESPVRMRDFADREDYDGVDEAGADDEATAAGGVLKEEDGGDDDDEEEEEEEQQHKDEDDFEDDDIVNNGEALRRLRAATASPHRCGLGHARADEDRRAEKAKREAMRGRSFDSSHCLISADLYDPLVHIKPREERGLSTGSEQVSDSKQCESEGEDTESEGMLRRYQNEFFFDGKRGTHSRASSGHSSFYEGKRGSSAGTADTDATEKDEEDPDHDDDLLAGDSSSTRSRSSSSASAAAAGLDAGPADRYKLHTAKPACAHHSRLGSADASTKSSLNNNNNNNNNNNGKGCSGGVETSSGSSSSSSSSSSSHIGSSHAANGCTGASKGTGSPCGRWGGSSETFVPGSPAPSEPPLLEPQQDLLQHSLVATTPKLAVKSAELGTLGGAPFGGLQARGSDLLVDKNGRFRLSSMQRWTVDHASAMYLREQMTRWDFGQGGLFARLEDPRMPKSFAAQPLTTTFMEAMMYFKCTEDLGFDGKESQRKMILFMDAVEKSYKSPQKVFYHNSLHATDVLQSCVALLNVEEIRQSLLDDAINTFAVLFSAAIHDVAHPGRNQSFLVKTQSQLSLIYNDRSVLEHHHLAKAFSLLRRPEFNFADDLSTRDWVLFRERVIQMVLGTDLALHIDHMGILKELVESSRPLARAGAPDAGLLEDLDENAQVQSALDTDLNTILCSIVHVSDVGNTAKPWLVYRQWITLVFKEFFDQGDEERTLGLEVAKGYDRNVCFPCEMQIGFFDYIVEDFIRTLSVWSPALGDMLLPNLRANRVHLKAYHHLRIQDFWPEEDDDDDGGDDDDDDDIEEDDEAALEEPVSSSRSSS